MTRSCGTQPVIGSRLREAPTALFPHVAINAVSKVTSRLAAEGWLNEYPVF